MAQEETIKPVNVKLPESLHLTVKAEGIRRRLTLEAAYQQALEQWLGAAGRGAAAPVTANEEELIRRFLRLWHHPQGVMEPEIRDLVAKALGVEPPKME